MLQSSLSHEEQYASLQAAVARTLTRSAALYFSRPVRLFRPTKVSGWHSLRVLASQHGSSLTPQYLIGLLRTQGFIVIPKHFIPPMLVNAFLGTVLWTAYAETFTVIEPHFSNHPIICAGMAGSIAGGTQALLAAPAVNVRIALEGGSRGSWSEAWKEIFRSTTYSYASKKRSVEDIRQLRNWMRDVGEMAGRGWSGWGWGLGKDVCGFAAFFSIFEVTRRVALKTSGLSQDFLGYTKCEEKKHLLKCQLPRIVHGVTLITGGVIAGLAYEKICLPWDVAQRTIQLGRITQIPNRRFTAFTLISQKIREDGLLPFFQAYDQTVHHGGKKMSILRREIYSTFRTLGRVGPWGVGFLVWEAYGYGLSPD